MIVFRIIYLWLRRTELRLIQSMAQFVATGGYSESWAENIKKEIAKL
jgi:hypothetical protein